MLGLSIQILDYSRSLLIGVPIDYYTILNCQEGKGLRLDRLSPNFCPGHPRSCRDLDMGKQMPQSDQNTDSGLWCVQYHVVSGVQRTSDSFGIDVYRPKQRLA